MAAGIGAALGPGQAPTLAALTPLEENFKGAVDPLGITGQAPVKLPHHLHPAPLADAHGLLLRNAHMAHLWIARGFHLQGGGDRLLGELNLQHQGALHHRGRGLGAATAPFQAERQQQHKGEQGPSSNLAKATAQPLEQDTSTMAGRGQGGQHGEPFTAPMIGWLQGELADPWQQDKRYGLQLRCQGVGYDVQVHQRQWQAMPAEGTLLSLHIHAAIREDGWTLYGFGARQERDLFRELVAVSGVGPQLALGLLGNLEPMELVQAIVHADLRRLSQAPGVGKRTAERLAVELRSRLQQRFLGQLEASQDGAEMAELADLGDAQRDEVQLTLGALGYEGLEIQRAIRAVASQALAEGGQADDWIRECLRWLSRDVA